MEYMSIKCVQQFI